MLTFGAYEDLERLITSWLVAPQRGVPELYDPLVEGRRRVFLGNLVGLVPAPDRDPLRRAPLALLRGEDVWIEAFKSLRNFEYRGDGSFMAWVSAIARHKIARKAGATRRKGPEIGGQGLIAASPGEHIGPSTEVRKKEDTKLLRAALAELDEDSRQVLQLSWFEELKHREVGQRLGIAEDAAACGSTGPRRSWRRSTGASSGTPDSAQGRPVT